MDRTEALSLLDLPLAELLGLARRTRRENSITKIELCNILNARSGACTEDCRFCAQSSSHSTGAPIYPLKDKVEILEAARRARAIGAKRFDIVTSGNRLTKEEVSRIASIAREIRDSIGIDMCASLGGLDEEDLDLLKGSGISRYHHNIETSPGFFPNICTTHTFQDRIATIKAAKKVGLEVCSGGIIGMGESWADRIEMALILKELQVDSIPLNVLVPIKGTSLGLRPEPIPALDAIRTIAIFRIILKDKIIKLAAGRESVLKDFQAMAFMAGANGMLIGGYLTIKGRSIEEDRRLVEEAERLWLIE